MEVEVIRYGEVQACFSHVGARTRHEIAEAVAPHADCLKPISPPAYPPAGCPWTDPPRYDRSSIEPADTGIRRP